MEAENSSDFDYEEEGGHIRSNQDEEDFNEDEHHAQNAFGGFGDDSGGEIVS